MRKKRRTGYFITVAALVCSLIGNSVVVSMAADQEYSEVEVQENKNPDNAGNENETDKVMDSDEPTEEPTEEPAEDLAEEDSTETDSEMKDDAELKGIIELVYIVLQSVVKPGITGFFKIDLHIKCYIYLS